MGSPVLCSDSCAFTIATQECLTSLIGSDSADFAGSRFDISSRTVLSLAAAALDRTEKSCEIDGRFSEHAKGSCQAVSPRAANRRRNHAFAADATFSPRKKHWTNPVLSVFQYWSQVPEAIRLLRLAPFHARFRDLHRLRHPPRGLRCVPVPASPWG